MEVTLFNKVLLGLTAAAHLVLGTVVYRKNPRSLLNRLVIGFTLVVSFWTLVILVILFQTEYDSLLLWIRISHAVGVFFPWFVLALVYCFREESYPTRFIVGLFVTSCLLAVLSMTPLIIAGVDLPLEQKDPVYGPLFFLYITYFFITICYGIILLFRQLHQVQGIARFQIRYFIGGIILSFILGAMSNVFLPLLGFKALDMRSYGPVFGLIMAVSITYSIAKYRLMDIHMALHKVLVYGLTIILLGVAYSLPLFFLTSRAAFPDASTLVLLVFLAMVTAVFFQPTKELIRTGLVERYLYRATYNYYTALREVSRAMVSILNLEKLLEYLVTKVVDTAQIQKGVFYLRNKEGAFEPMTARVLSGSHFHPPLEQLVKNNPLMVYLGGHEDVLLRSDLRGSLSPGEQKVADVLSELEAEAAVPVIMGGTLSGVFILGPKLSGEPYSKEDVTLLLALSSQLAVALKNAQYHREVAGMKQYLENVLENMGNGLVTIDSSGRIITFNGAAEGITGLAVGDVMGRDVDSVLNPELSLFLRQTLLEGRGFVEREFEITTGQNRRFLNGSTAIVEFPDDEFGYCAILVLSDVTRQKELEKEKSRTERLASLGELAAGMAHEIKNPLVSIKTFAELLPEKFEEQDFRYSFSSVVGHEIERINNLVTKLLKFARDAEHHCVDVDINDVMEEVLLLLSPQMDFRGIGLSKSYAPALPTIRADRNQLKQALFNICQNSVEAMPEGGSLGVDVLWLIEENGQELPGWGQAGFSPGEMIKIVISDTGEGISMEKKDKVFDPFFTTKSDGVGIGLSISHRILQDYGGEIRLESVEGQGTVFEVLVPADGKKNPLNRECFFSREDISTIIGSEHNTSGRKRP